MRGAKNELEQSRVLTKLDRRTAPRSESNPGHYGGKRVLSPMPCSKRVGIWIRIATAKPVGIV